MANLLFIDPKTPHDYDFDSIRRGALGGTEATLIRIILRLAAKHKITLAHAKRTGFTAVSEHIDLIGLSGIKNLSVAPDHIIIVKKVEMVPELVARFPAAKIHFYFHTISIARRLRKRYGHLHRFSANIICVSHTQAKLVDQALNQSLRRKLIRALGFAKSIPVHVIYNPIDDDLKPDDTPRDLNKMLFVSSPTKGLAQAIERFFIVKRAIPELEFHVANPGYKAIDDYLTKEQQTAEGVVILDALPHHEVMQQMRSALCIFYPQTTVFETFGIIYAEANAVGTPVLALDFGAAREVLSDEHQLVPDDNQVIIQRIRDYQQKKIPIQPVNPAFRLSNVVDSWLTYLSKSTKHGSQQQK